MIIKKDIVTSKDKTEKTKSLMTKREGMHCSK
jgi:hypothetical protein